MRSIYAFRALRFLSMNSILGALINMSASFSLTSYASRALNVLPCLLTGDYVPVDALDEALDELALELFPFFIVCVAGFTVCDICSVLNLLSVRVLSLRRLSCVAFSF